MRLVLIYSMAVLFYGCGRPYEEPLPCPEYTPIPRQHFEDDKQEEWQFDWEEESDYSVIPNNTKYYLLDHKVLALEAKPNKL